MEKVKTVFFCQNCGVQAAKWLGKCPSCGEWNTYQEEIIEKATSAGPGWKPEKSPSKVANKFSSIADISSENETRIITPDNEFNRVLGGGIVPGSLVLIGGEPGIGKSTLLLQLALSMENMNVYYVSGEESSSQIKMRADRIKYKNDSCFLLNETSTQNIFTQLQISSKNGSETGNGNLSVGMVIIDSIQSLYSNKIDSPAGTVSQIKQCTAELQQFAKETGVPVFLIGHITKEGSIAGPKVLEHIVDTVLQFEGDQHYVYRILRTIKNRFGSTAELGIYEMRSDGLRQVTNPSEILLSQRDKELSGMCIASTLEGLRPMMIETQALVSHAVYGTPQRTATGFDLRRLSMLLAVLEKRCGFKFATKDVFLNIAGGIRVEDPAIDLGVVGALISSLEDIAISSKICFAGEVGLSGEIRAVSRIEQRIAEADKLGFETIFISKFNQKSISKNNYKINISMISKVDEVVTLLFK
ncbi:MAG: DNA repair protein RadA [Bacteroidetes bacterium]|nr:DNA repair protein RadA [Bacteroidota bacterium]